MELVAFLGSDKENWGQVVALMNRMECERIFLVKDRNTNDIPENNRCEVVNVDTSKPILDLKQEIMDKIKENLRGDFEVALSLASGNGKEHMAIISALLSIPVGIRLVVYTKNGVEYIN